VHDLDEHVTGRAVDDQARTLGRTNDLLADTAVTAGPRDGAGGRAPAEPSLRSHAYLPAFPTLRRICSPGYGTPLPWCGSGLRSLRLVAATSPTVCLSMPSTWNSVGFATRKVMPSGASRMTGWLKPSENSSCVGPLAWTR